MSDRRVIDFQDGSAEMKKLLGGKGANLAEMMRVGLPVPPGFTVTTDACRAFYASSQTLQEGLMDEISEAMFSLEQQKGQTFGDPLKPLLVSVRSGSVTSMPGMMDTILNLGLNDETAKGLAVITRDSRFAADCYRRFIQMFSNVVFGVESIHFEHLLQQMKQREGVEEDQAISAGAWEGLIVQYKALLQRRTGHPFPQNVYEQLRLAVDAVFRSWNNQRAITYRKLYQIPDEQGTAVNIQSMVFGNKGDDCGTGVIFTRNPSTGEKVLYGEYLTNAQGEDVVSGARTPRPIAQMAVELPEAYVYLAETANKLEQHYKDMQDIEFTVESGKLYMLQTRNGKRTAAASVRLAVHFMLEGIITREDALMRVQPEHLDQLLHRGVKYASDTVVLAKGLPASPGAAVGRVVFTADAAEHSARHGEPVVLIRTETTPEDIHGVIAAEGVLTSRGGMTSHAAVVARGMGKPCVCGCVDVSIDEENNLCVIGEVKVQEGDWITIDGTTGRVIQGIAALLEPELSDELTQLLSWADDIRTLQVLANADHPADAAKAREFGAQGIGLCRTEHMFMSADRLPVVQQMILAETVAERKMALSLLLPMQREDFEGIFRAMDGLPVTIRLLDPPLHEFLPSLEDLLLRHQRMVLLSEGTLEEKESLERLIRKVRSLKEANPMLGLRGCRLGIVFPEIYEMQVEAIFQAVVKCRKEGIALLPEIMIPLVGHAEELRLMRELVDRIAAGVLAEESPVQYKVGTMIEVPRAAITAQEVAQYADFFSFGTNDLTQMTLGYSRDDAEGKFLTDYIDRKLVSGNPFQTIDTDGVGMLVRWAAEKGRERKPGLKAGVCGEHGGDPQSIAFCLSIGLNYVSCSPYRVPLARISAAQAELSKEM